MLVIDRKLLGPDGMPGPELLGTLLRRHAQERVRLDEIGEIAALTRLGRISKPCIIYDVNGFYQPLMELFENMIRAGFLRKEERSRILVVQNVQEIEKFIKFSDTESYAL